MDIAVLKINNKLKNYFTLDCDINVQKGMSIFAVGYPLFQPLSTSGAIRRPTCTKGILASIAYINENNRPALLQTSALIHEGNSGGCIVNSSGDLLGLVTSNAKHLNETTSDKKKIEKLIPSMNFAISVHALKPIADFVACKINQKQLQEWADIEDERMSALWTFKGNDQSKKRESQFMRMIERTKAGVDNDQSEFLSSKL